MNIDERIAELERKIGSNQTMLAHGNKGWILIFDAGDALGIKANPVVRFFGDTIHEAVLKAEEALL